MTRVLIVEDNKLNREMLSRRLVRKGYHVDCAGDGREGVDKARATAPHLILMDMSLPVLDGWQAVRELRAAPESRGIPIIALTAHAMVGDRERALEAGCDDYETKPVELPRLLTKIQAALDKARPPAPGPGRSVIVVDDRAGEAELSGHFQQQGFRVAQARTGAEALDNLRRQTYDVMVLDLQTPETGLEVLDLVRAVHPVAELPIIVSMAKDRSEDAVLALERGASDYVTRPHNLPHLLARVQTHLSLKKRGEERNTQRSAAPRFTPFEPGLPARARSEDQTRISTPPPWEPQAPSRLASLPQAGNLAGGEHEARLPAGTSTLTLAPVLAQPSNSGESLSAFGDLAIPGYEIIEELGRGGMGVVFKARHERMNRIVALKVINKENLGNANAIARFYREIQAAAQLHHPNIVTAFDAGQCGDTRFFAMEYVEGIDLGKWVKELGPLSVPHAAEFIRQAALGLQHAHERGLVHRDVKPANLLVTTLKSPSGKWRRPAEPTEAFKPQDTRASLSRSTELAQKYVVKITDMGLALLFEAPEPGANASALTREGRVVGTADYMAPEQWKNAHKVDVRADLYSLGCTFYYVLTGSPPFPGTEVMEKMLKHHLDEPTPLEDLVKGVPPEIAAIVRRLLAKNPHDRFQEPAELAEALA